MSEHTFDLTANTSVRLLTAGKYCDRDIVIHVVEAPDTGPIVAKIGDTEYRRVKTALEAAQSGQTVLMIADSDETGAFLHIPRGVTLDLAGHTLTAASMAVYPTAIIADGASGASNGGVVNVPNGELSFADATVDKLPFWISDRGYAFVHIVSHAGFVNSTEKSFKYWFWDEFYALPDGTSVEGLLADGGADNGLSFHGYAKLIGGVNPIASFTFSETNVEKVYAQNQSFALSLTNVGSYSSVDVHDEVWSDTGAKWVGPVQTWTKPEETTEETE